MPKPRGIGAWLREFRADQAGLAAGNVLHGTVIPPLPCRLRLDVRLQRCDRPRTVEAAVDGDLRGQAVLRLADAGGGTRVAVAWSLEMRSVPLRLAARAADPVMRWGHDRVVGHGGLRVPAASAARRRGRPAGIRRTADPAPAMTGPRRQARSARRRPAALRLFPACGGSLHARKLEAIAPYVVREREISKASGSQVLGLLEEYAVNHARSLSPESMIAVLSSPGWKQVLNRIGRR